MGWLSKLPFIGDIIGGVKDYQMGKQAIKAAELAGKIKRIQSAADDSAEWEILHAKGSMDSWKDEYVLIMLSVPTIMVFIPFLAPFAEAGFDILRELPEWYRYLFVTVCLASYGIKMKSIFWPK